MVIIFQSNFIAPKFKYIIFQSSNILKIQLEIHITGEHLTTDDDNTYSYVHVLDEPVVENDYI